MNAYAAFALGFILGGNLGVLFMCTLRLAKLSDAEEELALQQRTYDGKRRLVK